jgi:hypothetical protein
MHLLCGKDYCLYTEIHRCLKLWCHSTWHSQGTNYMWKWVLTLESRVVSWEADPSPAGQEISCILWNMKVHCCVHSSLPLVPVLSHINPVHTLLILSSHLYLHLPSGLFPTGFPTKTLHRYLFCPYRWMLNSIPWLLSASPVIHRPSLSLLPLTQTALSHVSR